MKKQSIILLLSLLYGSLSFAADIKYYDTISPYFINGERLERKSIITENDESKNVFVKSSHLEINDINYRFTFVYRTTVYINALLPDGCLFCTTPNGIENLIKDLERLKEKESCQK